MNFSDYITNNGKRICKDHYINLVHVSKADGKVSDVEMEMLIRQGKKFGLTDPEIANIIKSDTINHYNPPYSLSGKFTHLYNVAQMILADDVVNETQLKMIKRFAIEAGFNDKTIEKLLKLLFEGIRNGEDEDKLLKEFKKNHLFKD